MSPNFLENLAPMLAAAGTSGSAPADTGTLFHVATSVSAFAVLGLAGVLALLVVLIDHSLKNHRLTNVVQKLPPMDKMENLLFLFILVGFVLLTLALMSGLIFVNDLLAQHLVHKTVISFMAWFVFGTLLLGRWLRGWRGGRAVRFTLAGFGLLLLSYFGSKFVLEVILGRSWWA